MEVSPGPWSRASGSLREASPPLERPLLSGVPSFSDPPPTREQADLHLCQPKSKPRQIKSCRPHAPHAPLAATIQTRLSPFTQTDSKEGLVLVGLYCSLCPRLVSSHPAPPQPGRPRPPAASGRLSGLSRLGAARWGARWGAFFSPHRPGWDAAWGAWVPPSP